MVIQKEDIHQDLAHKYTKYYQSKYNLLVKYAFLLEYVWQFANIIVLLQA